MNIHEYQAKEILRSYELPVLNGYMHRKDMGRLKSFPSIKGPPWVVKSQIHAGGRGAGHFLGKAKNFRGIKLVHSRDEVKEVANLMLGDTLVTKQTGPQGKKVNKVYIEEGCSIKKEFYLSLLIDRKISKIILMVSLSGGMDIEKIASEEPDKIITCQFEDTNEISDENLLLISKKLNLTPVQKDKLIIIINKLFKIFIELDASTIEINPIAITDQNLFILLDAKMIFDDNALHRQPEIIKLRDESEEDALELEASKNNMNYVKLDGTIGCMVNGAGLAMATMDIIKNFGSKPANFLDLGGTANKERAVQGFKIIQSDLNVKSILINIFGGIIRCDMIAEGIILAAEELKIDIPIVVRFQGNNADKGRDIINNSKLNIIGAKSLNDAAKKAVEASYK